MTEFHRAPMRYHYRINPDDQTEIQVKHNKPRARWRHQSRHGNATQAQTELWRLVFVERDRRE